MQSDCNHLLVAGATGVAAQDLIGLVGATPGWSVTGLSRTPPAGRSDQAHYIKADLLDPDSCRRAVADQSYSHVVYAARARHGEGGIEDVDANVAMLRNIVTACEGPALRHVHAVFGGKWYGVHIGPFRTPARESDPTHLPPNYYFDQQALLIELSAGKQWSWSTSRPNAISGVTVGEGRNLLSTIGAYAAICRHLNVAFDFPGKPGAYGSLLEMTDARLLAQGIFWMCTSPAAANQDFNLVNGDLFRWENFWPVLADHFGVRMGRVRQFPLARWMADKGPVWDRIVQENDLMPLPLNQVASWEFADFVLGFDYDVISSMSKARKAGFLHYVDTEEMILCQLGEYRARRVLP